MFSEAPSEKSSAKAPDTIHPLAVHAPLLSATMAADPPVVIARADDTPTVLVCDSCEVTWRDTPSAPCWFCGEVGHVANPERLVLD